MTQLSGRTAALLAVPPLLWAANAVVGRALVGLVPPFRLNAMRWCLALLLLLPFAWPLFKTATARHELQQRWKPLALLGLLGVGSYNALQYLALATSTPVNVTLITAGSPVVSLLLGAGLFGERPARRALAGAALSLAGVAVVLARGEWSRLADVRFVPGDALMLLAVLAWSGYGWALARPAASMAGARRPAWAAHWAGMLFAQTLFGLCWAGTAAAAEAVLAPAPVRWSAGVVAALAFTAVGPSIVAYRCFGLGVAAVGPTVAAFFVNLTPLFAAVLSAALLGLPPEPYHALAFALIVGGIAVSSRR